MDESAKKGLELNGSDAEIRKSSIRRISVEGYDTSLRREDLDEALRKHFASCGKIIHVSIPRNYEWTILCKYAFVYFNEEDEEKALRLDGSEMGGQILRTKSYPFHETYLNDVLDPMKEAGIHMHYHTAEVSGYDNSLPLDVVEKEIKEYFSAHNSFVFHTTTSSGATKIKSYINLWGQEAVDTALERSGRSVGGLNLVVTKVFPIPKKPMRTGYVPPRILNSLTKEQRDDPNLYFIIEENQKKRSETTEGNQKKRSETTKGNQMKKRRREIRRRGE